jgi:hypothetical protein
VPLPWVCLKAQTSFYVRSSNSSYVEYRVNDAE